MRVLVTGGAGFIGSHLVEALLARGDEVTVLDNFEPYYPESIKRANLAPSLAGGAHLIEADLRDAPAIDAAIRETRPDVLVHLAAQAGVRPSLGDPHLYVDINIKGTINLLEAARAHGPSRIVFASSSSVYGLNESVPFRETDPILQPASPYGSTKGAGELICHTYSHLYDLQITALRFFTVYGPRQRPDMAIHKFAALLTAGRPVELYGRGSVRDYTYISDIVAGMIAAIDRPQPFRVYNLGAGGTTELDAMVEMLASALEVELRVERRDFQPGDVPQTFADVSRARAELDYEPKVAFAEGVRKFADWFRKAQVAGSRT